MRTNLLCFALTASLAGVVACEGPTGPAGAKGDPGATGATGQTGQNGSNGSNGSNGQNGTDATAYGVVTGAVTDTYGNKVAGATVSATVGDASSSVTADSQGVYTMSLPPGARSVTFAATGYIPFSQAIEPLPNQSTTLNVRLNPTGPFAVTARRTDSITPTVPGTQVELAASSFVFDSSLSGQPTYKWTLVSGPPVTITNDTSATPSVVLGSAAAFKKYVVEMATLKYKLADEPLVNIDRYRIVPISYEQAMSQGNTTKLMVTATLGGKSLSATVNVAATIPVVPSTGLQSVPVNSPVVLQGQIPFKGPDGNYLFPQKDSWSWSIAGPDGAAVTVNDATTAYPDFTPTVAGKYVVSEGGVARLEVYAGTYTGMMTGPGQADATCNQCHNGNIASDNFTPWLATGHRGVLYAGVMEALPGGHYAASCTPCHSVGSGLKGAGGFADKATTESVKYTDLQGNLNVESQFWALYPQSAKLAGIQCENCHGPAGAGQHGDTGDPKALSARMTYSANVCGTCHARAPKHGRYPQWIESGHSNMSTFTYNSGADGTLSTGCAVCHSAQGFAAYRAALPTANGNRSLAQLPSDLRVTNAEPITCQACHDSHSEGEAGAVESANLAKVGPIEGNTYMLPSGFAAIGVGKGALCISCHNSRQGYSSSGSLIGPFLHEDGDPKYGTLTSYGAPHEACQGDVLLGRNAYWLGADKLGSPETRSKHSYITDTCVTCHMKLTDPHPTLAEAGQMRHDFKATTDVCNKCHTDYSTESVQAVFDDRMLEAKQAVGNAILRLKFNDAIPAGTSAVLVPNRSGMVDVTVAGVTRRWFINDKSGQDAFLSDPNNAGALPAGCIGQADGTANCTGYLSGAPGIAAIGSSATQDATVSASGVNGIVAKALWNLVLVQDDASRGVHNPSFSWDVLTNTLAHTRSFLK